MLSNLKGLAVKSFRVPKGLLPSPPAKSRQANSIQLAWYIGLALGLEWLALDLHLAGNIAQASQNAVAYFFIEKKIHPPTHPLLVKEQQFSFF